MSGEHKKYYSAFIFEPGMSDGLHCTHCYFGTMNGPDLAAVIMATDAYFGSFQIKMPKVEFTVPALFGPDCDIRVLLTSDTKAFEPVRELREFMLERKLIGNSAYPYRPHVTTKLAHLSKPFYSYVLACKDQIIKEWVLT